MKLYNDVLYVLPIAPTGHRASRRHKFLIILSCSGCFACSTEQFGGSSAEETSGASAHDDTLLDTSGDTPTGGTTVDVLSTGSGLDAEGGGSGSHGTDASSFTGEPISMCGNGVTEAFGPEPEECDDGNDDPDDGCTNCGRDRRVFITSDDYQGGIFMGLIGADQRCRSLAGEAGLPNSGGFMAWLSDSTVSARDRMFRGRGRYVLVNGLVVADSWDSLLTKGLKNPIDVTEISETKQSPVWTGTMPDGSAAVGADHCADWSGYLDENRAFYGLGERSRMNGRSRTPRSANRAIASRRSRCIVLNRSNASMTAEPWISQVPINGTKVRRR